ncbi:hypothetical protein Tco_1393444 [Tanacetum coccineum]
MANLKFVDTHNMVAFLSKPAESKGFEQIVDFLNAHPIKHALMVNPIIYTLCIKQFWATVKAKTINGEVQLQALVDGKKIIITESTKQKLRKPKRKDTQISQSSGPTEHVTDEAIYKELDDSLATPNEVGSQGTTSGGGPSLTTRVESSRDEESLGEDASKQGRINAIDSDEDITLVNDQDDADMFDVNTLTGDEVLAEQEVAAKDVNLTVDEVSAATTTTTATILTPRKGIVITELGTSTTTTTISSQPSQLQTEFDEKERLKREKDEANVALTEEWDNIQAKVDADYQLAQRLQAEEQEQFTTKQKATLFKELLEQRRKHFAAKRAEEKRNKPPTQA